MARGVSAHPVLLDCEGAMLAGTFHPGGARTPVLIVSGGAEPRAGAGGWQRALAGRLADAGHPVLRFDRRGVGDSAGNDTGFEASAPDMAAAAAQLRRLTGGAGAIAAIGNCDAATAIALHHASAGIGRLVLLNPWVVRPSDGLPPPAAIRRRYADRLRDPRFWWRALRGGVSFGKALRGVAALARRPAESGLAARAAEALARSGVPATAILARGDATALAFSDAWTALDRKPQVEVVTLDTGSHSFAGAEAAIAGAVLAALG
jgi:exosortase A-associated hydrolase 1